MPNTLEIGWFRTMRVYNEENKFIGEIEIPAEVIAAAEKVKEWLQKHDAIELYGLKLAE